MYIVLTILLVILLILVIILMSSAVLTVYYRGGEFRWAVRYFGIRILPFKKKKEHAESEETEEASEDGTKKKKKSGKEKTQDTEEKRKPFLADKFRDVLQMIADYADMAGNAVSALPGPLQRIFKAVTLGDLDIDFLIANEDASECAQMYGRMQILVQNLLANLSKHIRVKRKRVQILCDFTADESRWDISFRLKVHIGTVVGAGLWLLIRYWLGGRKADKAVVDPRI